MLRKKNTGFFIIISLVLLPVIIDSCSGSEHNGNSRYLEYKFSEPLFTTFSWINTGMYFTGDSSGLSRVARDVCRDIENNISPSSITEICKSYSELKSKYDWMLGYVASVVAINCTDPPGMRTRAEEIKEWDKEDDSSSEWILNRLDEWETVLTEINDFYKKAGIKELMNEYKPIYDSIGSLYLGNADIMINRSLEYLNMDDDDIPVIDNLVLIVNLIGPGGEMGPEFRGIKYDIKGPGTNTDYRPHELLHSLVKNSTKDTDYASQIQRIVSYFEDQFIGTPGAKSYPDKITYFDENLVRTLDHIIYSGFDSSEKRRKSYGTLKYDVDNGFVMVQLMHRKLVEYESSNMTFTEYFPFFLDDLEESAKIL